MTMVIDFDLPDESATRALGAALLDQAPDAGGRTLWVALHGPLGAGKSTLVRGALAALGWNGPVPSPTYTLVEPYTVDREVWHLDLYRLGDASEWDELGVEDAAPDCLLIEWPERIPELASRFDLHVRLDYREASRVVQLQASSPIGEQWLSRLRACFQPIT